MEDIVDNWGAKLGGNPRGGGSRGKELEWSSMRWAFRQVLNGLPGLPCATQRGVRLSSLPKTLYRAWYFYGIDSSRRHSTFGQR